MSKSALDISHVNLIIFKRYLYYDCKINFSFIKYKKLKNCFFLNSKWQKKLKIFTFLILLINSPEIVQKQSMILIKQ